MPRMTLLLLLVCLTGCSKREAALTPPPVPRFPQRVVSMAPGITEILLRMDAGSLLVGISNHCPALEGRTLPRLGSLASPSIQALVALQPDLVLTVHMPQFERQLLAHKIPFEVIYLDSFNELLSAYHKVGGLLGLQDQARALERSTVNQIGLLKRKLKGVDRRRVLLVLGPHPRWVAGSGSMFDDMIKFARGTNAATRKGAKLYALTDAELRRAAPDLIVELLDRSRGDKTTLRAARRYWSRFKDVPAIKNGQLVFLDERLFLMIGPNSVDGTQQLARALHPDRFQ